MQSSTGHCGSHCPVFGLHWLHVSQGGLQVLMHTSGSSPLVKHSAAEQSATQLPARQTLHGPQGGDPGFGLHLPFLQRLHGPHGFLHLAAASS